MTEPTRHSVQPQQSISQLLFRRLSSSLAAVGDDSQVYGGILATRRAAARHHPGVCSREVAASQSADFSLEVHIVRKTLQGLALISSQ
jgi:hypothetical protein